MEVAKRAGSFAPEDCGVGVSGMGWCFAFLVGLTVDKDAFTGAFAPCLVDIAGAGAGVAAVLGAVRERVLRDVDMLDG